jgi:hypothetical protein
MPYILHKDRVQCDKVVKAVVDLCDKIDWDVGAINYIFSRILYKWFIRRNSYTTICKIRGTLGCVSDEFYRRVAAPYEDMKKHVNGDVYL